MFEAYLVETQGLEGLSGAPVFVRPTIVSPDWDLPGGKTVKARLARLDMFLLGLWHAAWKAPADTAFAIDYGRPVTVPVGMGVVVPATKIMEVLEIPELQEQRRRLAEEREEAGAAALTTACPGSQERTDVGPDAT